VREEWGKGKGERGKGKGERGKGKGERGDKINDTREKARTRFLQVRKKAGLLKRQLMFRTSFRRNSDNGRMGPIGGSDSSNEVGNTRSILGSTHSMFVRHTRIAI
jgi:hypothetical protein